MSDFLRALQGKKDTADLEWSLVLKLIFVGVSLLLIIWLIRDWLKAQ